MSTSFTSLPSFAAADLPLGSFATTTYGTPVTGEVVGHNYAAGTVTLYIYDETTGLSEEREISHLGLVLAV